MFKNVAGQKLIVFAFDATTNLPKTGDSANLTAYVSKDYGAVTVLTDLTATELEATNAKGYYTFDLSQAETNGDILLFTAKSSTANVVVLGKPDVVFTVPAGHGLDEAVDTGMTLRQLRKLLSGLVAGKSSNKGADFRDINDTKDRINSTLDADGNRTAVVWDGN